MAMGTRSKVASMSSSLNSSDHLDSSDLLKHESRRHSSSDDRLRPSFLCGQFGPQIEIFQNCLRSLTLFNFCSAADIAQVSGGLTSF